MEGDVESQNNFFPSAWETSLQHMCSKHQRKDLNFQSTSSWVKWLHGPVFQMPIWKNLSRENNLYSVLQIFKMLRDGRGVKILSAIKTWIILGQPFCGRGGLILEIQASADSWMLVPTMAIGSQSCFIDLLFITLFFTRFHQVKWRYFLWDHYFCANETGRTQLLSADSFWTCSLDDFPLCSWILNSILHT